MKRYAFLLLLFLLLTGGTLRAQSVSGTDFWITFMENQDSTQGDQSYYVVATASRSCSATVTNPVTGWSQTWSVSPNSPSYVNVPLAQGHTQASSVVTNTGFHVTSTDSIALFIITRGYPNMDYANVLPTPVLRDEYIIQSYPTDRYPCVFSIVSAEPNTVVDITLACGTLDGHGAGSTYSITLPQAGQVCQVQSVISGPGGTPGDFSGTHVKARGGKKIAVFHGNTCVYIPSFSEGPSCDHVVEQALPVDYWGKHFIATASRRLNNKCDRVRITAGEDSCRVYVNGSYRTTLAQYETYQYQMAGTTSVDYIATTHPAQVYLYFPSMNSGYYHGDPSMTTIPPLEQRVCTANFTALATGNIQAHHAIIITPTDNTANVLFDNVGIASQFSPVSSAPSFSYCFMEITSGTHHIADQDTVGFIAYLYGFGPRESYGYTVGFRLRALSFPTLYANGLDAQECFPNGIDLCLGDTLQLTVDVVNGVYDHVRWLKDGIWQTNADTLNNFLVEEDTLEFCAEVYYYADTLMTQLLCDTLCTTVRIHGPSFSNYYDTVTVCQLPYRYHDNLYYGPVECDTVLLSSIYGCDSTVYYHLAVVSMDTMYVDTAVCRSGLPLVWHGVEVVGDTTFSLIDSANCIYSVLTLGLLPDDTTTVDTVVCQYDLPITWHNHTFYYASTYTETFPREMGCDSVVVAKLYIIYCPQPNEDSCAIWVPNVFTPNLESNNTFRIYTHYIEEATVYIYHRWGDFVTKFDGLRESWDGTKNGRPCQEAAYVYKIVYRTSISPASTQTLAGTVTLVR